MALNRELMDVLLTHSCPYCGNERSMKGSWFAAMANDTCTDCRKLVTLTYEAKIALFAKHAHLGRSP